jgi:hypothetical protein
LLDFHGEVATEWACDLSVAAGASAEVALPSAVSTPQHPQRQLLVAEYEGLRDLYFFATDAELAYPDPQLAVSAEGSTVRLHAAALARDVLLQADRLGGTPTAGLVTLLPGESVAIDVRDDGAWEQALVPPVLQHMGGALRR